MCLRAFASFNNDNFTHVYFSDFGISENLTDAQGAELDGLHKALLFAHQAGLKILLVLTDCMDIVSFASRNDEQNIHWCHYAKADVKKS